MPSSKKVTSGRRNRRRHVTTKPYVDSTDSDGENECREKSAIKCDLCNYTARRASRLKRHLKSHETKPNKNETLKCPELHCGWACSKFNELDHHLFLKHQRVPIIENHSFEGVDEFNTWRNALLENAGMKYISKTSIIRNSQVYHCNRSKHLKRESKATGKRGPRKNGSIVSDKVCSSRFKVVKDGTVFKVTFHRNHYCGHWTTEPERRRLTSSPDQGSLATQIPDGVFKSVPLKKLSRTKHPIQANRAAVSNIQEDLHVHHSDSAREIKDQDMDAGLQFVDDCYHKALKLATDTESVQLLITCMNTVLAKMERHTKKSKAFQKSFQSSSEIPPQVMVPGEVQAIETQNESDAPGQPGLMEQFDKNESSIYRPSSATTEHYITIDFSQFIEES